MARPGTRPWLSLAHFLRQSDPHFLQSKRNVQAATLPTAAHIWRLRISSLQNCRSALRVDLIVEDEREQPTGPGLLGRPLAGPRERGASKDAY
jgi:hypothetical protein